MNNPFDLLQEQLNRIENKLGKLDEQLLLHGSGAKATDGDQWFDINELVAYDPEKRTKPTFYGYVHNKEIPFHKPRKKLLFLKSEIDSWLKAGRKKTITEINAEAHQYLKIKRKK